MARTPTNDDEMHIDIPAGPQYPQGPSRATHARTSSAVVDTPDARDDDDEDTTPGAAGRWTPNPTTYEANLPRYRSLLDDPNSKFREEPPAIPSALPIHSAYESAPLPKIPMIVLSIVGVAFFDERPKMTLSFLRPFLANS